MKRGPYAKLTIRERLMKNRRIDETTGCWLWTKTATWDGHGQIQINGKSYQVHRIAWQEFVGPIKNQINHKRNCPNKKCFNPSHLYDGTQFDNVQDTQAAGQHFGKS